MTYQEFKTKPGKWRTAFLQLTERLIAAEQRISNLETAQQPATEESPAVPAAPVATDEELMSLLVNRGRRAIYDLGRKHGAAQACAEHLEAPRVRYRYSPVTIAECGGPCEQGPEHCDCGEIQPELAPAPTGSLVERVVNAMDEKVGFSRYVEARAAIREQAAWLRELGHVEAAAALVREAN